MRSEQRQFVRVSADCPVKYRVIDADDPKKLKSDIFDSFSSMEVREIESKSHVHEKETDRHMMKMLLWLDWKVTYLIKLLAENKEQPIFPYQAVISDLSASGMKLHVPKTEPKGTSIQVRLILPILPFKELIIDAEVVWTQEENKGGDTEDNKNTEMAVAFRNLKEANQEDLFRYIIKRERQVRFEKEADRRMVESSRSDKIKLS